MKKLIFFTIIAISAITNYGQSFAPVGAEWYYNEQFAFSGDINYIQFTSEKDTLIYGENCSKITKRHKIVCNDRPELEFLFSRNDTVFFLDTIFNEFQILYDFNAIANESWMIKLMDEEQDIDTLTVTVDSVSTTDINGFDLKTLYVTYFKDDEMAPMTYNSTIIEKIGDINYMFNWYPWSSLVCDGNYSTGLRCYQDSDIGLYSTGIVDSCNYEYIWTGLDNEKFSDQFELFPNPCQDFVDIAVNDYSNFTIGIYNLGGQLMKSEHSFNSNIRLDVSILDQGVYVICLLRDNEVVGCQKLIKD